MFDENEEEGRRRTGKLIIFMAQFIAYSILSCCSTMEVV